MDSLGDRMKGYEEVSRGQLVRNMPVVIRVDGRAFHTFTHSAQRPFDQKIITAMQEAACCTAMQMQGFKVGYVQSDEATFVITDYDTHETQGWFDYCHSKILSITAATMTAHFNRVYSHLKGLPANSIATFDARAFNVPRSDVLNNLLWRAQDWARNSIQMVAQAHFTHKQLHGKNCPALHEMLHGKGINWATDFSPAERNGTFLYISDRGAGITMSTTSEVLPKYQDIEGLFGPLLLSRAERED